jgi:hypothetical protein
MDDIRTYWMNIVTLDRKSAAADDYRSNHLNIIIIMWWLKIIFC